MGASGTGGLATLAALRQIQPDLPCCLTTGRLELPDPQVLAGVDRVLAKPFSTAHLVTVVRQLCQQRASCWRS